MPKVNMNFGELLDELYNVEKKIQNMHLYAAEIDREHKFGRGGRDRRTRRPPRRQARRALTTRIPTYAERKNRKKNLAKRKKQEKERRRKLTKDERKKEIAEQIEKNRKKNELLEKLRKYDKNEKKWKPVEPEEALEILREAEYIPEPQGDFEPYTPSGNVAQEIKRCSFIKSDRADDKYELEKLINAASMGNPLSFRMLPANLIRWEQNERKMKSCKDQLKVREVLNDDSPSANNVCSVM